MLKRLMTSIALGSLLLPIGVSAVTVTTDLKGELIKASQPTVYFYGEDGKRYVFPNEKIFFTWYTDFSSVRTVTDAQLAAIQIGGNVTYRPGTKLVKVTTDPKVYAVSGRGQLRWITSESLAKSLYGEHWAQQVQDLPDAFFQDYNVSSSITNVDAYKPETERNDHPSVSSLLNEPSSNEEWHAGATSTHSDVNEPDEDAHTGATSTHQGDGSDEHQNTTATTTHVIVLSSNGGKSFSWTDTVNSPSGYKLVWSKNEHPTYPTRVGDSYVYFSDATARSGSITGALDAGVRYFVRVCNYDDGVCGTYSNQIAITGTDQTTTPDTSLATSTHTIVLTATGGNAFSWTDTATSTLGYKLVWSTNMNPTYPTRDGDHYVYYSSPMTRMGMIGDTVAGSTYYVRVCQYLGDVCGAYSNQMTITAASSTD